jgi:hypothetical protein
MSEPLPITRLRQLHRDLARLVEERARRLPELEREYQARLGQAERDGEAAQQETFARFVRERDESTEQWKRSRQDASRVFETEKAKAEREYNQKRQGMLTRWARMRRSMKMKYEEANWTANAVLEAGKTTAEKKLREDRAQVEAQVERIQSLAQATKAQFEDWRQSLRDYQGLITTGAASATGPRTLEDCLASVQENHDQIKRLWVPRVLLGKRLELCCVLLGLLLILPLGALVETLFSLDLPWGPFLPGVVVGMFVGSLLAILTRIQLYRHMRARLRALAVPLLQAVADATAARTRLLKWFDECYELQLSINQDTFRQELAQHEKAFRKGRSRLKKEHDTELPRHDENHQRHGRELELQRDDELRRVEEQYQSGVLTLQTRTERENQQAKEAMESRIRETQRWYDAERTSCQKRWESEGGRLRSELNALTEEDRRLFPPWDDAAWQDWAPPASPPPVLRFGNMRVNLEHYPGGEAADPGGLLTPFRQFTLPALCACPEQGSLLFLASDAGRALAAESLQTMMLRLLTSVPAGKVRFTILDPVGLGQNFAAFMNLADYDEALVGSRIWTETGHIDQRLADLTAHMENVIQKYLRNQYASISEYNAQAGEVAEPFRVLVVANFPANFSADAARRLLSVVQNGPRCGVSVLMSVDTRLQVPQGFNLDDLFPPSAVLTWGAGVFGWDDRDFGDLPLTLEPAPPPELANRLLHDVGKRARDADRVQVPFEFIAPPREAWWTSSSRGGIDVPLGRAGATKRQHVRLGRGTSQHVLVVGKTGSGKSTFLHALVTNMALMYSPDEVELYLIDFKKGVEFKTYATEGLPHARVIAIESEREFGLSVLQRLDAELKARGERFRKAGVQDLPAYRIDHPNEPLPRMLLIVDEFQEFFTEDDRIAQDAAGLLDRLVRQGRAFGLHLLLGSQTLGGAFSLARSTIDQMAVRVALQCSEADAQLILSADNTAARLLSRPGEAIYNDANGLVEGNNPFQVVWLDDDKRAHYLHEVQKLAEAHALASRRAPALVFEGNASADVTRNEALMLLLHAGDWPAPRTPRAWLGEAMAIKDPTAMQFRRQSGCNLLLVGQQHEEALGMMATALVSLAAQLPPREPAQFYVVDASPSDLPHAGLFRRVAESLPHRLRVAGAREIPAVLEELSADLEERQKSPDIEAPPVFLMVFALQRCRDLRKAEDDYSFGRSDGPPAPPQRLSVLAREGPPLGIHTLLWCDTLNNVQRSLDRQTLREFETRVPMQMSVADSSNLIDTPLASKLGMHRAIFFSEEEGRLEKFRPYGLPSEEWLRWVENRLRGRARSGARVQPVGKE